MTTAKTVLVVEDDPGCATLVEEILVEHNYRVIVASDGVGAIDQTNHHHVDLVLMDIGLPLFSGIFFCDALRHKKNTKNIPVVMMSANMDGYNEERSRQAGAVATVKKPFSSDELIRLVEANSL